jgi:hypothetical protein
MDQLARKRMPEIGNQALLRIQGDMIGFEAFNPPAPKSYTTEFKLPRMMSVTSRLERRPR